MEYKKEESELPTFFHILNDEDKQNYILLRYLISSTLKKYKRYNRVASIQNALILIHEFCIKNNADDWKRCFVCGVCWIGECIAINTRHLSILINKCKSSINGAVSQMGYEMIPNKSPLMKKLTMFIPIIKENLFEKKQWTIRKKVDMQNFIVV